MKAVVFREYGSPDVLRYEDVEKPIPADHDVLIKVRAASIALADRYRMRGTPWLARLMNGLRRPKTPWLGTDVAGEVEAVGRSVTRFKPGDAVFGLCLKSGSLAEYVCNSELRTATKPARMTFEQAAAVSIGVVTTLQGLRRLANLQAGQHVLVNGAAGGVGQFAVQIAKALGAQVTGVCSTRKLDLVRSLGADRVLDYTREDFTKDAQKYDVVFDCVGNHSPSAIRAVLAPTGMHLGVGIVDERFGSAMMRMMGAMLSSAFRKQKVAMVVAKPSTMLDDLTTASEIMAAGKLTPVIDRCYRLNEAADAMRHLESRSASGKIVVTV